MRVPVSSLGAWFINPYTGETGGQGDPLSPVYPVDRPINYQAETPPDYVPPIYILGDPIYPVGSGGSGERPPDYTPPIFVLPTGYKGSGNPTPMPYYDANGAVQHTLRSSGGANPPGNAVPLSAAGSTGTPAAAVEATQVPPLNLGIMVVAIVGLFIMAKR